MKDKIEESKATTLSNEIMKRPNLEEDISFGLLAKKGGRSRNEEVNQNLNLNFSLPIKATMTMDATSARSRDT